MSTFNFTSNGVNRNQVAQSYYTVTGDILESDIGNDHNVGTDGLTIGIPKITAGNLGCTIFFRNSGAAGNNKVVISPDDSNKIIGSVTLSASVVVAGGVLGKDWELTKATSIQGDWCALRAVSLTEWYIIGCQGIWASEG